MAIKLIKKSLEIDYPHDLKVKTGISLSHLTPTLSYQGEGYKETLWQDHRESQVEGSGRTADYLDQAVLCRDHGRGDRQEDDEEVPCRFEWVVTSNFGSHGTDAGCKARPKRIHHEERLLSTRRPSW
jgi:hypothetical protein